MGKEKLQNAYYEWAICKLKALIHSRYTFTFLRISSSELTSNTHHANFIETINVKEKFKTDQHLLVANNPILLAADD